MEEKLRWPCDSHGRSRLQHQGHVPLQEDFGAESRRGTQGGGHPLARLPLASRRLAVQGPAGERACAAGCGAPRQPAARPSRTPAPPRLPPPCVSSPAGLAQQQLENMLQVPESDQSQFRSCYPGAGWGNAISLEFRNLAEKYQTVIVDVCQKMGFGMAEFLDKRVTSEREWDKYCHYVAGLVGIGLSRLFSASELEDPLIGEDTERANSMGLFLQKTNIIRDYLEDQREGREFWPQETWSKYVKKLGDFAKPENIDLAVQCLNELITNTLHHIPDVITYLSRLRNQSIFNFCAIPQVMAIATLAACYNNQQVFKGVVKIRKGQAVTLMMDATNMPAVKAIIHQYMEEIYHRIPNSDPCSTKTQQIISTIRTQNLPNCQLVSRSHYSPIYLSFVMLLAALSWQYLSTLSQVTEDYVQTGEH
ncbi:squalene synthase isoform X3 [Bos mutus]|uniref:squalene synthase isoform X3 n=1 Tax=Bos mutus TaxID=72004 RepID=UPI0038B6AEAF